MKLISYRNDGKEQLALLKNNKCYDTNLLDGVLPNNMNGFLAEWESCIQRLSTCESNLGNAQHPAFGQNYEALDLMAPVPYPGSCRDGYAFRQHVAAARRSRNATMIPEFDQYPVFYFTNHRTVRGPGKLRCMPDHFFKLDFELEVAIVICKQGENIKANEADQFIGGLMIMNDMSARTLQQEEMLLNLGPAKGKDFCTALGPWLLTTDELEDKLVPAKKNHVGKHWNLSMSCSVNGIQVSSGNLADMDWTFAELIERASYGVMLYPGDIIGSGTVGTGCFLELNGTGKYNDEHYAEQWLQPGDTVELEVERLGKLTNTIVREDTDYSILSLKKNLL